MAEVRKGNWTDWLPLVVYPAVSGILLAAAFPPLPLGFLSYVALLPLLLSAERLGGRAAFGAGFVQGLVFCGGTIYWVAWITPPGMVGAVVYLSLFRGLFLWVLSAAVRRFGMSGLWGAPFLWVGIEYLNTLGDMGFPWLVLGNTQTSYLPLIQYAEVTGVYGVSFWIVLVNLVLLALLRARAGWRTSAVVLFLLFGAPAAQGLLVLSNAAGGDGVPVGVVQSNVAPVAKENWGFDYNFDILKPLTIRAAEGGARLVIWPEAAVPAYFQDEIHRAYRDRVQGLADSLDIYLYTGASHLERGPPARRYNSSFLFTPGKRTLQRYDKTKLVPFGERAPFPGLLPFLRKIQWSGGGFVSANWDAGRDRTVFQGPGGRFSALICFDSVFPDFVRQFVVRGAEFLVVITNDGWFGRTSGPYQHAEMAVYRAIENRRAVVRCANTGVSTLIDAYGRKAQTTGIFHQAVLNGTVSVGREMTFYTQYGDVFSRVCAGLSILLLVAVFIRGRTEAEDRTIAPKAALESVPVGGEGAHELGMATEAGAMPFLDHLEALRWHLLKALAAVVAGAILCAFFSDAILNALTYPIRRMAFPPQLITLKPIGMFVVKLEIILVGGGVLALPIVLHQIWLFVAPGLFPKEQRYVAFIIVSTTICFVLGAAVAYWGVVPLALMFLVGMTSGTDVVAQFDIGMYIGFILRLLVAFGVVFELPVATFFLAKVGVLTADMMRSGRRYAVMASFILAAILTPPDPISQLMMALPLLALYEVSIWVARVAGR